MNKRTAQKNIRKLFSKRRDQAVTKLKDAHHDAIAYLSTTQVPMKQIGTSTMRILSASAVSSALLFAPIELPRHVLPVEVKASVEVVKPVAPVISKEVLSRELISTLPSTYRVLSQDESTVITRLINQAYGIKAYAEYEGNSLNLQYGRMGYEQHLLRYPGDSIAQHGEEQIAGMAPKTGAWSYFAQSKNGLTEKNIEQEKYYWAVQTYLSPGWDQNVYFLKDWFKYRKMIAVNIKTGDAVVGVVADAGPAVWTGKNFGGSPEAMKGLHLHTGMRNGEVILFFVDDPDDLVPLGPVKAKK